jgi:hypothetical protein
LTDLTTQFIDLSRWLFARFLSLVENFGSPLKKGLLPCTDHGRVYAVTTYQLYCGGLFPKGSQGDLGLEFRAVLFAYFLLIASPFFEGLRQEFPFFNQNKTKSPFISIN